MSIKASPEVNAMIFILTGEKLIDADEDLAYESRRPYSGLGRKVDRLSSLIDKSIHDIAEVMPDDLSKSYAKAMGMLIDDGGKNYLREFAEQLEKIAEGRRKTSMDIMESKWQVIAEVIRLLIEIAIYLAMSFFTGGASASQIMMAKLRSRFLILTTLSHLLQRLHLAPSLTEAFAEAFTTFAVRLAMMHFAPNGRRPDGFDWGDILKSAAFGAAAGFLTSIFDDIAKKIVKSYDTNFLKDGSDLDFKPNPHLKNTPNPEFGDHGPGPKPDPGPSPTPKDRPDPGPQANGPDGVPHTPPPTFRNDNPLSFRNNPNLWRNSRILRNNADRPGALAGHYGIKGTSDFLAAGAGEALAEILIKGAFDGDWSTSWSTFVGAGISSQVEATLTDTALNSGAELRHVIDKLRHQPPTVSTGDTDTHDTGTRDTADSSGTRDGEDPGRTGGAPDTDLTGDTGSPRTLPPVRTADSPPPYTSADPPPYSPQDPPAYTPGALPATATENALWQQVHNGPADIREQALHDIAALRGAQSPGGTEIDVRDSLHDALSQVPEVRVVPLGEGPALQVAADEVRRALDGFGTATTVADMAGGTGSRDVDVTSGSNGIVESGTEGLAGPGVPGQVGGSPVASNSPQQAPGSGTGGARPGGSPTPGATHTPSGSQASHGSQTPTGSQPEGTRTPDSTTVTVDQRVAQDGTATADGPHVAQDGTTVQDGPHVAQDGSAQPSVTTETSDSAETTSAPDDTASLDSTSSQEAAFTAGPPSSSDDVLTPDPDLSGVSPKVSTTGSYAGTGDVSEAQPLTIVVSEMPPPVEGSPEAAGLLDRAGITEPPDLSALAPCSTAPEGSP
ncbi:WXG100-like domain-containing protein, partial [Streptomyces nigra]